MWSLYCDGACTNSSNRGGWAFLLLDDENNVVCCGFGRSRSLATSNKMELLAIFHGLRHVPEGQFVKIHTDSTYCRNIFKGDEYNESWLRRWKANGWKNSMGLNVQNQQMIEAVANEMIRIGIENVAIKHLYRNSTAEMDWVDNRAKEAKGFDFNHAYYYNHYFGPLPEHLPLKLYFKPKPRRIRNRK